MGIPEKGPLAQLSLPPGFRFYPTDEELLVQYLLRKVAGHHFDLQIIGEVDLYKFDPWVLPSKATFGEKEWYFFSPRDRKYPNGSRPNRVAGSGYWKATGTDKVITTQGRKVGIKKALVFYVGKAPKGTKTNWIMHEYRLLEPSRKNGSTKLDDWVLCRIYKKNSSSSSNSNSSSTSQNPLSSKEHSHGSSSSSSSHLDDMLESLPEINDPFLNLPRMPSLKNMQNDEKFSLQHMGSGNFDWASLLSISTLQELNKNNSSNNTRGNQTQTQTQFQGQQQVGGFNQTTDVYVPSIPPLCHVDSPNGKLKLGDEEVQSGISPSQVNNSGFFQQNSGLLTQCFNNPVVDQFGFRYPSQSAPFAFRQ